MTRKRYVKQQTKTVPLLMFKANEINKPEVLNLVECVESAIEGQGERLAELILSQGSLSGLNYELVAELLRNTKGSAREFATDFKCFNVDKIESRMRRAFSNKHIKKTKTAERDEKIYQRFKFMLESESYDEVRKKVGEEFNCSEGNVEDIYKYIKECYSAGYSPLNDAKQILENTFLVDLQNSTGGE